jgi:hypothetical protein
MVLPGVNVDTVPSVDVVVVVLSDVAVLVTGLVVVLSVVVVASVVGLVVVLSVVVVLVCANARGATNAQPSVINVFFMLFLSFSSNSEPAASTDAIRDTQPAVIT